MCLGDSQPVLNLPERKAQQSSIVVLEKPGSGRNPEDAPLPLREGRELFCDSGKACAMRVTRRLCEGYFTFKALGPTKVKGVAEPVAVNEVTGLWPLRTKLQRSAGRGLTKFVGRERETEALKRAAQQRRPGTARLWQRWPKPGWASRACPSSSRRYRSQPE
jgi:hypothetical protein